MIAALLLLAACADSDEGAPDDASGTTTTQPPPADDGSSDAGTDEPAPADEDPGEPTTGDVEPDEVSDGAAATVTVVDSDYVGDYSLVDEAFGTMTTVTVDGSTRTIESNALPNHETGEFPNDGNPNTISAQDNAWTYPSTGTFTGAEVEVGIPGVAVNGVKYEPGTAETVTCASGEFARVEAVGSAVDLGLDMNNAHVQPTGEYHYHGISELFVGAFESDDDLVHVGFAADGFLVYSSKSGAYSSSWQLSTDTRTGTDCELSIPTGGVFDLEGTAPDGTYDSDWDFVEGSGDLDRCNGTTVDGEYVYLITDTYPYISRCLNGEPSDDARVGGGGGAGGGPGGAGGGAPADGAAGGPPDAPDLSEAAAELGVTEDELVDALGNPPDPAAAADRLGIPVAEVLAVLPPPPA